MFPVVRRLDVAPSGPAIALALACTAFPALLLPSCAAPASNLEPAEPSPDHADSPLRDAKDVAVQYPVNEHGNTYGSLAGMPDDVWGSYEDMHALFPDLVLVEATNGATGYVWKDELDPPPPASPEEAVATTKERKAQGKTVLTVYEQDGRTAVGEFELG